MRVLHCCTQYQFCTRCINLLESRDPSRGDQGADLVSNTLQHQSPFPSWTSIPPSITSPASTPASPSASLSTSQSLSAKDDPASSSVSDPQNSLVGNTCTALLFKATNLEVTILAMAFGCHVPHSEDGIQLSCVLVCKESSRFVNSSFFSPVDWFDYHLSTFRLSLRH